MKQRENKNRSKLETGRRLAAVLLLAAALHGTAQGQIKIEHSGRVVVGPDYASNFDPAGVLTMSLQGPNTANNNAGSKLGFGDFGTVYGSGIGGWNVFVGEYGSHDSDQLWLHGKKGIRLTSENGNTVLAEFGCDESSRVYIFHGLLAGQVMTSSDDGLKSGVEPIRGALSRLLQLDGVRYRYTLPGRDLELDGGTGREPRGRLEGKDLEDSLRQARMDSVRAAGVSQYGFMTAELGRLFPELVTTDGDGNSYVDYGGLIPVLVAALGEQQQAIDALNVQLQECCRANSRQDADGQMATRSAQTAADGTAAVLYQNSPNPFRQSTEIGYFVPATAREATLHVFSLGGKLVMTLPVKATGRGSVTIEAASLPAGMYVYSLVVDGSIVDSKRMILTE